MFIAAMWEGIPNAVMTGREEPGFPKLFQEMEGHRCCVLAPRDVRAAADDVLHRQRACGFERS